MLKRTSIGCAAAALVAVSLQWAGASPAAALVIDTDNTEGPCDVNPITLACTPFVMPMPTPTSIVEGDSARYIFHQYAEPGLLEDRVAYDYVGGIFRVTGIVDRIDQCEYSPRGNDLIPEDWIDDFANGSWSGESDAGNGLTVQVLGISDNVIGARLEGQSARVAPYFHTMTAPPGSRGKYLCAMSGAYIAVDGPFSGWSLFETAVSAPRVTRITPVSERVYPRVALTPDSTSPEEFTVGDTYQMHAWIIAPIGQQINGRVVNRSLSVGFADELDDDGTATCDWESVFDLTPYDSSPTLEESVSWTSAAYYDSYAGRYICAQQYISYDSPEYGFIERWSPVATLYVNPPADPTGNRDLSRFSSTSVMEDLVDISQSGCLRNPGQCSRAQFVELIGDLGDIEGRAIGSWDDDRGKDAGNKDRRASAKEKLAAELASIKREIEATGLVERYGKAVNWSPSIESQFAQVSKFDPQRTPIRQQGVAGVDGLKVNVLSPGEVPAGKSVDIELMVSGVSEPGTATTYVYTMSKSGPKLVASSSREVKGDSATLRISGKELATAGGKTDKSGQDFIVVTAFTPANKKSVGVAAATPLRILAR